MTSYITPTELCIIYQVEKWYAYLILYVNVNWKVLSVCLIIIISFSLWELRNDCIILFNVDPLICEITSSMKGEIYSWVYMYMIYICGEYIK